MIQFFFCSLHAIILTRKRKKEKKRGTTEKENLLPLFLPLTNYTVLREENTF